MTLATWVIVYTFGSGARTLNVLAADRDEAKAIARDKAEWLHKRKIKILGCDPLRITEFQRP